MKLAARHCIRNAPALDPWAIDAMLAEVPGWRAIDGILHRDYTFESYRATLAFVNTVAQMADQQDHHPELAVGYRRCGVTWTTHSAGGALTENDFICAARTDALYAQETNA